MPGKSQKRCAQSCGFAMTERQILEIFNPLLEGIDLNDYLRIGLKESENRVQRFKLLLDILLQEYSGLARKINSVGAIVPYDAQDSHGSFFNDSQGNEVDTEFFPAAASTCNFGEKASKNSAPKVISHGLPKPFKVDPTKEDYVPDTCLISDAPFVEREEPDFTIVPETQDEFQNAAKFKMQNILPKSLERRVQNFDTICPDITETFGVDHEQDVYKKPDRRSEEQIKDEAIREKYPPLHISTKSTNGYGSSGGDECDSPSVLTKSKRLRSKVEDDEEIIGDLSDDEDFTSSPQTSKAQPKKRAKKSHFKAPTNKFGMEINTPTESQITNAHNMKQATIDFMLKGNKKSKSHADKKEEEDIQRALKESLKDALPHDSFNDYATPEISKENARKLANVPVKKKEDREKLVGFSCKDCEKFYAEANLNDEQLQDVIQRCSRHRATIAPPPSSPEEMWHLDIDGPDNVTQFRSPLKTRNKRKLSRQKPRGAQL